MKFIDDDHFEIICLDYGDTNSVRRDLEEAEFVSDITSVDESDELHLQKILGKTSHMEKLNAFLDDWFERLAEHTGKTYSDFD
ncbi:hypothetical protein [Acinetobacter higginsii]|uniref:hypothetical protein n=1 Tax=Acinetobacter higginsii TaxID=70347 RepID=UPI003008567B